MISTVIAFELEQEQGDAQRNLVELTRQLQLLRIASGIRSTVYCGPMEEAVLRRVDHDGKEFGLQEFVTLYNLDFCSAITDRVMGAGGERRLTFEALRELMSWQRDLYRDTGSSRFVLLITTRDSFHVTQVRSLLLADDVPETLRRFYHQTEMAKGFPHSGMVVRETDCLKAFLFVFLRDCFHGQNVRSVFLPPVSYVGSSEKSPMLHFTVVCEMGRQDDARTPDRQTVASFSSLGTLRATDIAIEADGDCRFGKRFVLDPVQTLRDHGLVPK